MASPSGSEIDDHDPQDLLHVEGKDKALPPEPQNFGESPPFGALTLLFDTLLAERRQEKRKFVLERWFNVCLIILGCVFRCGNCHSNDNGLALNLDFVHSCGEHELGPTYILRKHNPFVLIPISLLT